MSMKSIIRIGHVYPNIRFSTKYGYLIFPILVILSISLDDERA